MGGFYWSSDPGDTGLIVCWLSMSINALAIIFYLVKVLCVAFAPPLPPLPRPFTFTDVRARACKLQEDAVCEFEGC